MWNAAFKDYKFVEYSHITSNSLKALFQKFYLVYFLTLCFIFCSRFFCFQILITITNEIRITAVNVLIYYIQLRNILASLYNRLVTAWKVSKYGVISGPYFPVFGLNTGKYGPEITPYLDTFHALRRLTVVILISFIIYIRTNGGFNKAIRLW